METNRASLLRALKALCNACPASMKDGGNQAYNHAANVLDATGSANPDPLERIADALEAIPLALHEVAEAVDRIPG